MKYTYPIAMLAVSLLAPSAKAVLQVTMSYGTSTFQVGDGGEFRATPVLPAPELTTALAYYSKDGKAYRTDSFQTFCMENGEHVSNGKTYYVEISDSANEGGPPLNAPDPISIGAAYLYANFAKGTLDKYAYGNGSNGYDVAETAARRDNDLGNTIYGAGDLQKALWALENEAGGDTSSYYYQLVAGMFADPKADNNGAYPVKVMRLWEQYDSTAGFSVFAQDQFILIPEPTTYIAGGLLGLPFLLSGLRMRFAKARPA